MHAFVKRTENYNEMTLDIVNEELKTMYGEFLESTIYMSMLFKTEVNRWTYDNFERKIINNPEIKSFLHKGWCEIIGQKTRRTKKQEEEEEEMEM